MDAIEDGCLLCRLGWRMRRGPKGELVDALEVGGRKIRLCKHHAKLFYGTEADRKEAVRIMAPHIYGGLITHERFTEGPHIGERVE